MASRVLLASATTETGAAFVFVPAASPGKSTSSVGNHTVMYYGTWTNGATAKVQITHDQLTWIDVPDSSATDDAVINVEYNADAIRAVTTSATAASITCILR